MADALPDKLRALEERMSKHVGDFDGNVWAWNGARASARCDLADLLPQIIAALDAGRSLIAELSEHMYSNDYCGLEISKANAPRIYAAIELADSAINGAAKDCT